MTTAPRPAEYKDNYGELVRAYRMYLGLSQRTMAEKLGIAERSLSDIEVCRRPCPRGFIDSVEKVVDAFEADVQQMIGSLAEWANDVEVKVTDHPRQEWQRAVVARAAVESGRILPVLGE